HADDEIVAEDQPYAEEALPSAQSPEFVPELLAMSSPPASPLSPWSSPPPQIPFPPLPPILSPPSPVLSPAPPPSPFRSLGYRAAMIRLRAEAASTSHSPPLQLPSASRREDRPEVTLPPRKKLGIALGPGYEVGESSSAAAARPAGGLRAYYGFRERLVMGSSTGIALGPGYEVGESSSAAAARPAGGLRAYYGFVATMDREIMRDPEREVGYGIIDSWDEITEALQGAPSERQLLAGRLNMLFRDRHAHAYTRHLMETEARMSREAWVRSTDASDLVRGEGQQGLAGGPTQPELPEEAGGSS
nr:hypothetical protein [Tanacetum cinerariifolium]